MILNSYISIKRSELFIGLLVLAGVILLVAGTRLSRLTNSRAVVSEKPVELYLTDTITLPELGTMLADSGVIDSKEELIWAGSLLGWNNFAPGHYQIDGSYSYEVLLSRMARGIQDPVSLTLIPGSTEERIIDRVSDIFQFDSTAFEKALYDTSLLKEFGIDRKQLIGRMFPNTYSMYWTSSPEAVLKRIFNEFDKTVVNSFRPRFRELDRTVDEIVTLASIIEWEASAGDDKSKISGVYWNRLKTGMRLQADPTVNYAIKERRRLLYEDYQVDHPYNTYVNRGLPPGPITNPSLSSIEAALFPDNHDYLYMVASPKGHHVYSETFEQHKKESAKWREWLRKQYRIKRQREAQNDSVPNS